MKLRADFDARALRWRDDAGRFLRARRGRRHTDRLGRAVELAALGHVVHTDEGYTVVSADGAHFYRVTLDRCDCPDSMFRPSVVCKHRIALALATRRLAEVMQADSAESASRDSRVTHELDSTGPIPTLHPLGGVMANWREELPGEDRMTGALENRESSGHGGSPVTASRFPLRTAPVPEKTGEASRNAQKRTI